MRWLVLVCALSACSDSSNDVVDAGVGDLGAELDAGADADANVAAPYSVTVIDNARITSVAELPNFQRVEAAVPQLHDGAFQRVTLVLDLTSTCFPFDSWSSHAPPSGQNWPADCDAFDRNFETSLVDPNAPDAPGLELVRAITPFGGPLHIEEDVTDVFNTLMSDRAMRITIPTWSDASGLVSGSMGGWNVTARLDVVPGTPESHALAVLPLVYDSFDSTTHAASAPFTLPAGTTHARIDYRVTGHGGGTGGLGCIGPADEFCHRTHTLTLDGAPLDSISPWRTDCTLLCTAAHYTPASGGAGFDYCAENPCGAMESVRAPRANWCPGSETPPISWQPESLNARGEHTFAFDIADIPDGAQWRVSASVTAYGN